MVWFVKALEKKTANGEPAGIFHLCAESDEGGGFYPGCDHAHPTAQDAEACPEARKKMDEVTGIPSYAEKDAKTTFQDKLVKHMVDRFLRWKLPEDFRPDGGIDFKPNYNEHTPFPARHEPSGTNLLNATQAEAMVRFMLSED